MADTRGRRRGRAPRPARGAAPRTPAGSAPGTRRHGGATPRRRGLLRQGPRGGIAEVDAVADALDLSAARLDELISRERAFSADASHQLRTPLAALRLELEALQLTTDATSELDRAVVQVDRLEQTIETLLTVARDVPRTKVTSDITSVLAVTEARWHGPLAAEGRRLTVDRPPRPPSVHAAPAVIQEILDVLLANALTHGSGPVSLTLRDINDEWIAIDVGDHGPGFPEPADAAFERRSGRSDGHGIGLALARSLAHAEGGRLAITHTGHPTLLTLTLRRRGAATQASSAPAGHLTTTADDDRPHH
ncbi:HAMP domain-containing histidine kinase [Paraconexibacter antarcticus]|uniref:histidine kinase n=1 Tax=Paraconexibacter antarcticus TaxID=2949664 RepID=A0ABY5DX54_9ACTN|nr:HAMP domain-containing sensor histidine kinase [Paraconexibacter antarcticus]UTI66266.1 HAMP domain-containing histidine kinase [Paraconexibacter antarcticus]